MTCSPVTDLRGRWRSSRRWLAAAGLLAFGLAPVPEAAAGGGRKARELRQSLGDDWREALVEVDPEDVPDLLRRRGGSWRARGLGREVLRPPAGQDRFDWIASLEGDSRVRAVTPNYRAIHPGCRQLSLDILEITGRVDLTTQVTYVNQLPLVSPGVTVAIVDGQVDETEDLEGRLLPAIDALKPAVALESGSEDGPVDAAAEDESAWDARGHGTAMAALVAAFAPEASILPVRVVRGDCEGTVFDIARGIELAAEAGADVINVSLGSPRWSPVLERAVELARSRGALVVASAGNLGVLEHPAALPGVVAVTAVDGSGHPPDFAPVGTRIDVAAPGVDVISGGPDGSWLLVTGTSPSAALVSAAAAAVVSRMPAATWDERRQRLLAATQPPPPGLEGRIGAGCIDLSAVE